MSDGIEAAADLFKALSSPARLRILSALITGPSDVGSLADATELSQPLVSQHLRTLRLAGIVQVERIGRNAVYSLHDEHIAHIVGDAVSHVSEARTDTD
ncbi:winged helix-turn-helix transcriptional regulator [Curtobacterium sp. VKM Ac-2889]|uniref:ArsR/SmtB family transcription factor n=1 Tax=Curtobacterium TaxID=2034 RepID=UPI00188D336A|nr:MULTISPECIES: metalloregulator ArsR/SmtB family transcription factor [Curtobacterium]MBF4597563.1 winged helix-turn-helix transcriptional regulator [Curtobacterium sp. VKM Ac-1796]MBF4612641.1 winged helix-turn-helix transcriptional regulator [Curtobacterium sp. VKM Ac-2889]MCS6565334.1 metalloregulator ArsR/SmtB family transcription factor [Curtobacterium flaccumfaciens pv. flaccumfaciens]MDD1385003.1 metalloregulator ArsR/SmtB family transcription factor [Curtobacterium flaccumfaciens pv. 